MQVDHILPEPHHHLRSRLPADPPVHIRPPRKEPSRIRPPPPSIGDRIPIKHHPLLPHRRRSQRSVVRPVPPQLRPVVQLRLQRRNLLLQIQGRSSCLRRRDRSSRRLRRACRGKQRQHHHQHPHLEQHPYSLLQQRSDSNQTPRHKPSAHSPKRIPPSTKIFVDTYERLRIDSFS